MLQYRVHKDDCVHRVFHEKNSTIFNDAWLYGRYTRPCFALM